MYTQICVKIVSLTLSKIVSLEKTQKIFGFLLSYSYLCPRYEIRNTLAQTHRHL